jgi:hypothetical protein
MNRSVDAMKKLADVLTQGHLERGCPARVFIHWEILGRAVESNQGFGKHAGETPALLFHRGVSKAESPAGSCDLRLVRIVSTTSSPCGTLGERTGPLRAHSVQSCLVHPIQASCPLATQYNQAG